MPMRWSRELLRVRIWVFLCLGLYLNYYVIIIIIIIITFHWSANSFMNLPLYSRWKVKFICSLCYKNGQISEATKDRKYCLARAQHSWATNKKTVLVQTIRKDWTQIRDLPYLKNKVTWID